MAKKKKQSSQELHFTALREFEKASSSMNDNHRHARDDMRMIYADGRQWDERAKAERELDGRPCLEMNKLPVFIRQVVGDQRQNRPQIKCRPVDSGSDVKTAEVIEGLIRNIEYISNAKTVYDTAFAQSVGNGFGYIRVVTEYADDDTFEQDIKIKRVINPLSVVFDAASIELDASDAAYVFITTWLSKKEFERKYPGKASTDFESNQPKDSANWYGNDLVMIAEWFRKVPTKMTLVELMNGDVVPEKEGDNIPEGEIKRRRVVDTHRIEHYVLSGSEVLEGPHKWPGKFLPIIPVRGEEIITEKGERIYNSIIRHAKDAQRMHNYWHSSLIEHIALQPKAPFIATAKQIAPYQKIWDTANRKNWGVLPFVVDKDAPMLVPKRQEPPQGSSAFANGVVQSAEDIKATIGLPDANLGRPSNETSGKAILARQRQGETSTFVWVDNLDVAVTHTGKVILDLLPHIYDTEREVRVRGEDDTEAFKTVNQAYEEEVKPGEYEERLYSLTTGKYDVVVQTGPSYNTKRQETAQATIELFSALPVLGEIAPDLAVKSLDISGADEITKRLRKHLIGQGLLEPDETDEEGEAPTQQEPAPPTPEEELAAEELGVKREELDVRRQEAGAKAKASAEEVSAMVDEEMERRGQ